MSDDFDVDDIAAMQHQGDLKAFMRSRLRQGPKATKKPPAWKPPPGHRPGGWPPGTGPVNRGDPVAAWDREWDAALDDYRTWIRTQLDDTEESA